MGKYSLIVVNKDDNSEHIINIYDSEKKEKKSKVHIKDIDNFTSQFMDSNQMLSKLKDDEIIDFSNGFCYVESQYKNKEIKYKAIFSSKFINKVSQSVVSGYICPNQIEGYGTFINEFLTSLKDDSVMMVVFKSIYFVDANKELFRKYVTIKKQLENGTNDNELLNEAQILRFKIIEELKRYKTFRGLYLFTEEQKKFGNKPRTNKNLVEPVIQKTSEYVEKPLGYRDVDMYNQEYEEFLSDEEYDDAYGSGGNQYIKGARHD